MSSENEAVLATATILAGMSDLRIELAESEKRFTDILRQHSEQVRLALRSVLALVSHLSGASHGAFPVSAAWL